MKDPLGFVLALLFTGLGVSWMFFPGWAYRTMTPEEAARDRRRFKMLGFVMFPLGIGLLVLRLFS